MKGRLRLKSIEACEREDWSLLSWPADVTFDEKTGELVNPSGAEPVRRRFLCGSWRCRRCSRWRGALDWTRCAAAVSTRGWWLYIVLTFDPAQYGNVWEAYKAAGKNWDDHLREALRHKGGKFAYLQTWEAHRSGWPHANLIISGDRLRDWVESLGVVEGTTDAAGGRKRRTRFPVGFRDWLAAAAKRAGFGGVVWAEIACSQGKYTGTLSRTRTGDEPAPRRTTRQRRELVRAHWSEVIAALEAEREARTRDVQGSETSDTLGNALEALAEYFDEQPLRENASMHQVSEDVLSAGDQNSLPDLSWLDEW